MDGGKSYIGTQDGRQEDLRAALPGLESNTEPAGSAELRGPGPDPPRDHVQTPTHHVPVYCLVAPCHNFVDFTCQEEA